eukprot:4373861-Amphidinium_carterae.1
MGSSLQGSGGVAWRCAYRSNPASATSGFPCPDRSGGAGAVGERAEENPMAHSATLPTQQTLSAEGIQLLVKPGSTRVSPGKLESSHVGLEWQRV